MTALLLTVFLEALDNQVVTVAMPRIISTLHGFERYTWVVTAYLLAATAVVLVASKLSDQFGRKGFLLGGVALFLLGSLLSGAAQTMNHLILFRAIQGLGSVIGLGLAAAVVGDLFPPAERASKQGLFGIVFGVANLLGPTVDGVIADHGSLISGIITASTRWRWLFYLNLPFGLFALLALWIALSSSHCLHWAALRRIDFLGAFLIAAATCCLLVGLTVGNSAWTAPRTVGLLVLFLQGVLALSPTASGAEFTVLAVCVPIGAALATVIVARRKRYQTTVITGLAIMIVLSLALFGLGTGTFFAVQITAAQNAILQRQLGWVPA